MRVMVQSMIHKGIPTEMEVNREFVSESVVDE